MGHENWRDDDPFERRFFRIMQASIAVSAVLALGVLGLITWAVVQLVQWAVTK